jgi:hypothetical protein
MRVAFELGLHGIADHRGGSIIGSVFLRLPAGLSITEVRNRCAQALQSMPDRVGPGLQWQRAWILNGAALALVTRDGRHQ